MEDAGVGSRANEVGRWEEGGIIIEVMKHRILKGTKVTESIVQKDSLVKRDHSRFGSLKNMR